MNRILTGLLVFFIICYFGICFGCNKAADERNLSEKQNHSGEPKTVKRKGGPFEIGKNHITVILEGNASSDYSFEIVDEAGVSHYKKELVSTSESTTEEEGVSKKVEGVFKLEGKSGDGLIFYFDSEPSAPNTGESFQIFGMEKGKIKPLSPEINIYGTLQPLEKGKSEGALRLFDGDLIKVEVWKNFFGVVVPLKVDLQKLTIASLKTEGIFDINIGYTPNSPGTGEYTKFYRVHDVQFFHDHNIDSKVTLIRYEDIKTVEFIDAFASVQLKTERRSFLLNIDVSDLWLKVKINGREGWISDSDSFETLGLKGLG